MSTQVSCCAPSPEEHARYSSASHLLRKLVVQGQTLDLEITGCWAVLCRMNRAYPDLFPHPYDLVDRFASLNTPGSAVSLMFEHPLISLRPLRRAVAAAVG